MSEFGWTYLSRDALRRAEAQLAGDAAGVRDEIGFLLIHQRYADRFFPGTSVLHTRLRYALFVPWMYDGLRRRGPIKSVSRAVEEAESRLAGRLLNAGDGVIGRRKHPETTSQPPSVVYWTALHTWGILRPRPDGRPYARARLHAQLQAAARIPVDDDGAPLSAPDLPFIALPKPPAYWEGDDDLGFELAASEAGFLHDRLRAVVSPSDPTNPSLLARLADAGPLKAGHCWAGEVIEVAAQDRPALERAGHAAALSAIGRAVYAALVETVREKTDGRTTSSHHRDLLPKVVENYARSAGWLDIGALTQDISALPAPVMDVLKATLDWVAQGAGDPLPLRATYAHAEHSRKKQRARLTDDLSGRERRLEWNNEAHTDAEPLHYRWGRVCRLIADLHGDV